MTSNETQQEPTMKVERTKEHEWLQKFVGEWTFEGSCSMGPGKPDATFTGKESVRSIGGLWVVGEGSGEMPAGGDDSTTIVTVGYNPQTKRFVGSWVGSMMTHMWVYDGWLDEGTNTITLEADGPSMTAPGETATYRDVVEFESDDHRILRAQAKNADGTWHEFMVSHYRRVK